MKDRGIYIEALYGWTHIEHCQHCSIHTHQYSQTKKDAERQETKSDAKHTRSKTLMYQVCLPKGLQTFVKRLEILTLLYGRQRSLEKDVEIRWEHIAGILIYFGLARLTRQRHEEHAIWEAMTEKRWKAYDMVYAF